jgi:hypothetical protein
MHDVARLVADPTADFRKSIRTSDGCGQFRLSDPTFSERIAVPVERFEIVVRGELSPTLVTALDGFDVSHCTDGLTHLVGPVPDQARIHSLFRILSELDIELVSVNPIGEVAPD